MTSTNPNIITSPYRRGADDGFIFGLYLSLMFFSGIFSSRLPILSLVSFALMAGVPAVIYYFIRRYDRDLRECATFAMMWMLGVVIFVCGILISGTLLLVYMKWIQPDFILTQLEGLVEFGRLYPGTAMAEAAGIADCHQFAVRAASQDVTQPPRTTLNLITTPLLSPPKEITQQGKSYF